MPKYWIILDKCWTSENSPFPNLDNLGQDFTGLVKRLWILLKGNCKQLYFTKHIPDFVRFQIFWFLYHLFNRLAFDSLSFSLLPLNRPLPYVVQTAVYPSKLLFHVFVDSVFYFKTLISWNFILECSKIVYYSESCE